MSGILLLFLLFSGLLLIVCVFLSDSQYTGKICGFQHVWKHAECDRDKKNFWCLLQFQFATNNFFFDETFRVSQIYWIRIGIGNVYAVCCMYPCATSVCASNASCHLFTSTDIFGFALAFKVSGFYAFVIFLCLFPLFGNVWFLVFACFFLSFIFPFSIQFTGLYMLSRCKYVVYK